MLLSLVVPEVARFFYREVGEIQWPRSFQSVVKRWPREGLRAGNQHHLPAQRVSQHSTVSTIIDSWLFFVTEAVRFRTMT